MSADAARRVRALRARLIDNCDSLVSSRKQAMEKLTRGYSVSLALFLVLCLSSRAVAQSSPIFKDPARDQAHPMHNEAVWIPSGGVSMNGVMYAAAGVPPHPTAIILHGLPGNEQNLDLAQTLRRAGYNVLSFHYRGSWGSPGKFTLANGVEDGQSAVTFLEDASNIAKFHIDPKRLIIIGHSYGGFVGARVAAAHPEIAAAVLIAPWSPAADVPFLQVAPEKFAATAHRAFDDVEGRLGGTTCATSRACCKHCSVVNPMAEPSFRFVCVPDALAGAPSGWAGEMLQDGEIALLPGAGGLEAINAVAHDLGLVSVPLVRGEDSAGLQEQTVMAYAESLPLVWVSAGFSDGATVWARDRGPMTLLVAADAALSDDERRRIERFVATLGRQSE